MNLLELFKQLTEEKKNEFIKLIIDEINKINKAAIVLKVNDSPVDIISKEAREILKKEEKNISNLH